MTCQPSHANRSASRAIVLLVVITVRAALCARVLAGEIIVLDLDAQQGKYQLKVEIILDAPASDIQYVITDYVHIYRLNPSIVESEVMSTPDNSVVRVKTLINDCLWIFCREILRVEDVRELENGSIHAAIVPRLSNIKSGVTIWQIQPLGRRARINYHTIIEPGIIVPPLIGSHLIKNRLRKEVLITLNNIERMARIRSQLERVTHEQQHTN